MESNEQLKSLITSPETVIVDFGATWCGICKTIAPTFTNLARDHPNVVLAKVDVDDCEGFDAENFEVEVMPTFQAFKNGQKVGEFSGADKAQLDAFVRKHTPGGSKKPSLEPEPEPEPDVSTAAAGAARSERLEKLTAVSGAYDGAQLKQLSKGGAMSTLPSTKDLPRLPSFVCLFAS